MIEPPNLLREKGKSPYPRRPRPQHSLPCHPGRGLCEQGPDACSFCRKNLSPRGHPSRASATTLTAMTTRVTLWVFAGQAAPDEAQRALKTPNKGTVCAICQMKQKIPRRVIREGTHPGVSVLRKGSSLFWKRDSWRKYTDLRLVKAEKSLRPNAPGKTERTSLPET